MARGYQNPIKTITFEMVDGRVLSMPGADVIKASIDSYHVFNTSRSQNVCTIVFLAPEMWVSYYVPEELEAGPKLIEEVNNEIK